MSNAEQLGKRLYELRKNAGLSQEDLSDKLGVSRQAVSKWECGESLPDTNNLISIARLYEVSLDELIGNSAAITEPTPTTNCEADSKTEDIFFDKNDHEDDDDDDEDDDDNDDFESMPIPDRKKKLLIALRDLPYPILITAAFLLWGFLWDGWKVSWVLFVTIPVYYSIIECIKTKRIEPFAFPVLIAFIYLLIGMQWGMWHPHWVLFLSIPLYYPIANAIDKKIKK